MLNPFPSWLLKSGSNITVEWTVGVINSSLQEGHMPICVKQVILHRSNLLTYDFSNL